MVSENIVLITKAFKNLMVIPAFEAFTENISDIYEIVRITYGYISESTDFSYIIYQ